MILEVISIRKSLFKGEVDSLIVPGVNGPFTILPRHVSIMSILTKGDVVYSIGGKKYSIAIESGFVEVCNDVIMICVGEEIRPKNSGGDILSTNSGEQPYIQESINTSDTPESDGKSDRFARGENVEKD